MPASKAPSVPCARGPLPLILVAATACLGTLPGCAKEIVSVEPIAFSEVSPKLKARIRDAACELPELPAGRSKYEPQEIAAALDCWRAAFAAARAKHAALAEAVELREAGARKAVKASP